MWNALFFHKFINNRAFDLNSEQEHPKNVKPWPSSVHPPEEPWPVVLRREGYNLVCGQHINPSNTLMIDRHSTNSFKIFASSLEKGGYHLVSGQHINPDFRQHMNSLFKYFDSDSRCMYVPRVLKSLPEVDI